MDKNQKQQMPPTSKGKDAKKIAGMVFGEVKKIVKDPKVKKSVRDLRKSFKDFSDSLY